MGLALSHFRAEQSKKPPCRFLYIASIYVDNIPLAELKIRMASLSASEIQSQLTSLKEAARARSPGELGRVDQVGF